jgi:hypothetical protein
VKELANSVIIDTVHADQLIDFCNKRNIYIDVGSKRLVGNCWYSNFMEINVDQLPCGHCKMQDQNQKSWCTQENFMNMYTCVYKAMVKAGVVIELDEEVMMDKNGNVALDPAQQFG